MSSEGFMTNRKTTLRMIQINAGLSRLSATAHEQGVVSMIVAVLSALAEPTGLAAMRLLATFTGVVTVGILTIGFTFNAITHWFI